MCGRFIFFEVDKIEYRFDIVLDKGLNFKPSFNIAPSEETLVIINENSKKRVDLFKWGFIPSWMKNKENLKPLINLRDDTLLNKENFSFYLKNNRCIIPANGFYEWKEENKTKKPYLIFLKDFKIFTFAGIYNIVQINDEIIKTFAIITTEPNEKIKNIHNRMPVILKKEDEDIWLDNNLKDLNELKKFIKPYPDEEIDFYKVSLLVNNPGNKFKELIIPYNKNSPLLY